MFLMNNIHTENPLSKCIAYAATQAGIKTLFTTTMDMINQLVTAKTDHTLVKKMPHMTYWSNKTLFISF